MNTHSFIPLHLMRFLGEVPRKAAALWGLFILQGSFQQLQYLFGGHAHDISGVLPSAEYDIRKPGFCLLQLAYLLLDGIPGDELIYLHVFLLPDSVSAVGSLIFSRAVPPRVVVYNNVRAGKVKPRAARFQRYQEYAGVVAVEAVHHFQPLRGFCGTSQHEIPYSHAVQTRCDNIQH